MTELPADCGSNSLVNVATITDFGFRRNWDSSGLDLAFLNHFPLAPQPKTPQE